MQIKPPKMPHKNIIIIGSSHIARESINDVKKTIEEFKPDIIALELDVNRYHALLSKKEGKVAIADIKKIGMLGYLFAKLGQWGSKRLGRIVGVMPGEEMLAAIRLAKKRNIRLALIDQNIAVTLGRFSRSITLKEKWTFIKDLFRSVFFRKQFAKEIGTDIKKLDLTKVPPREIISSLVSTMIKKYPNVYNALIRERDMVMARNIIALTKKAPCKRVMAVVGAGHKEGILKLLEKQCS